MPEDTAARTGPRPELSDRVTMPLITLVTQGALDEDYIHAARRRASAGAPAPARTGHRGAAAVTAVFGLMIALAAVQNSRNADVQDASQSALAERIEQRRADVASLQDRIAALRSQNSDLQDSSTRLLGALRGALSQLTALQVGTGFVTVTGPGVRITVDDNPDGSPDGRVRASDLRLLVNGLWEAGAEGIAINGRRLSALSAIVNSSIAVSVNRSPLTPPYVVSAVGDQRTLQADLLTTTSGVMFEALAEQFGFVLDPQNERTLSLPPAPESQLTLRWAKAASGGADDQEEPKP